MAKHAGDAKRKIGDVNTKWLQDHFFSQPGLDCSKWFLFQGAIDSPDNLQNITRDMTSAKETLHTNREKGMQIWDYCFMMKQEKSKIIEKITSLFKECDGNNILPVLYYTGHGTLGSGDWIFANKEQCSIEEVIKIIPKNVEKVFIFSDACYSGHWADYCTRTINCKLEIVASSPYCQPSVDGRFSNWLFNENKELIIPHPPVYGLYDYSDEEYTHKKEMSIKDFMEGHKIRWDVNNTCISFTWTNYKYSAIFGHKELRDSSEENESLDEKGPEYKIVSPVYQVDKEIKKLKKELLPAGFQKNLVWIHYIGWNDYLMFFEFVKLEQPKTKIKTKKGNVGELSEWVQKMNNSKSKYQITSCCPYIEQKRMPKQKKKGDVTNKWFVTMTNGFNKPQSILKESNQVDCLSSEGRLIFDGFCYNPNSKTYLITYMNFDEDNTKIFRWFEEDQLELARLWLREKLADGLLPYLISKDPLSGRTLIGVRIDKRYKFSNVELAMDFGMRS